ncbi:MAG: galactokinase [Bdellovibrionales bacterium]|nr:galactokinase [Ramlibacter sp.]
MGDAGASVMFATAEAPGRFNLLGEHTDYNNGFVLPVAIAQHTRLRMQVNGTQRFSLHSDQLAQRVEFSLGEPPAEHFASYVYGCLMLVEGLMQGLAPASGLAGLNIEVDSDVPIGVGLSSSAALEVACLRCLRTMFGLQMDDVALAQLAQRAEIEFAGVRCGIMDQMASSLADTWRALLIDTRSLERRDVPLPADSAVLVLDSGIPRALAVSGYNERRAQCEAAASLMGLMSLRDVRDASALQVLPGLLLRRARHVFTENARVLAAGAAGISASEFGRLMNESHASLRDDYEVSTPELDQLVALLQRDRRVWGARLTGAGFGGACVALCRSGDVAAVAQSALEGYAALGHHGQQLVPTDCRSA